MVGTAARVRPVADNWRFDRLGELRRGKNLFAKASESPPQLDNDRNFSDEELSASAKELTVSDPPAKSFCGCRVSSVAKCENVGAYARQIQFFYPHVAAYEAPKGIQSHTPEAICVQQDAGDLMPLSFL